MKLMHESTVENKHQKMEHGMFSVTNHYIYKALLHYVQATVAQSQGVAYTCCKLSSLSICSRCHSSSRVESHQTHYRSYRGRFLRVR